METLWTILATTGLVSAVVGGAVGLGYRRIEKRLDAEKADRAERDKARQKHEVFINKMLVATAAVCEANAIAMQNGKCNGETHHALERLQEIKRDQREFLVAQGIDHIMRGD